METILFSIAFAASAGSAAGLLMLIAGPWVGAMPAAHAGVLLCLAAYAGWCGGRWGRGASEMAPLFLVLGAALPFAGPAKLAAAAPAAAALAWLRSGPGRPGTPLGRMAVEVLLNGGGLALAAAFRPQGPLAWGLAVALFFLVQALYLPLARPEDFGARRRQELARFARAHARAERAFKRLAGGP
jgi:hypothetical protein